MKLALALLLSMSSAAFANETRSSLTIQGDRALPIEVAKEVATRVMEQCREMSDDDVIELISLNGRAGHGDFSLRLERTIRDNAPDSSIPQDISISVLQNTDVPFNREYTISCEKRETAIREQSQIEMGAINFSMGIDITPTLIGASVETVLSAVRKGADVKITKAPGLVIAYKRGSDSFVNSYAIPEKKMSSELKKIVAAGGALVASDLVVGEVKKVSTKMETTTCTEVVEVIVPGTHGDGPTKEHKCVATKPLIIRGNAQQLTIKAKI